MHQDYPEKMEKMEKMAMPDRLELLVSLANQVQLGLKASPVHKDIQVRLVQLAQADLLDPPDLKENPVLMAVLAAREKQVRLDRLDLKENPVLMDSLEQ